MGLIDTDRLKEYVNSISSGLLCEWDTLGVLSAIDKQQSVDAEPVVHGHWLVDEDARHRDEDLGIMDGCIEATCSKCGGLGQSNFPNCPWCRAKMDES